jgi:hypothetical protein
MLDQGVMPSHISRGSRIPGASQESNEAPPWASLLGLFYSRAGIPFPQLKRLKGDELPQPYRSLLAHSRDMTPTLEQFYRRTIGITVIGRVFEGNAYLREVTLNLDGENRPVEYGAIRIFMDHFPPRAQEIIREEHCPLGKILELEEIPHVGWPQAFFRVAPDAHMASMLQLEAPCLLYGRRNVLLDGDRRLLAEVLEVLAPAQTPENANK